MRSPFGTPAVTRQPTEAAYNFARDLLIRRYNQENPDDQANVLARAEAKLTGMDAREVSDLIGETKDWLACNKPEVPEIEDGFYTLPDVATPIRVIHAVHGSGHQYARALDTETGKWNVNVRSALTRLARGEGTRIDTDEKLSAQLGQLYGICMVCGTVLTDKSPGGSIELGIGPYCRAKRGW